MLANCCPTSWVQHVAQLLSNFVLTGRWTSVPAVPGGPGVANLDADLLMAQVEQLLPTLSQQHDAYQCSAVDDGPGAVDHDVHPLAAEARDRGGVALLAFGRRMGCPPGARRGRAATGTA